jgi:small subunit ribosomal protein S14
MAKTSQINRDNKRIKLIAKHRAQRAELRAKIKDPNLDFDEKHAAQVKLEKLPRNSCSTRLTRRCALTGRSRSVYRKFGLSRIMLRQLALEGKIPGMTKSSW